jgi:hypothetical protein
MDGEEGRRKREDALLMLRKEKKEDTLLKKRRESSLAMQANFLTSDRAPPVKVRRRGWLPALQGSSA